DSTALMSPLWVWFRVEMSMGVTWVGLLSRMKNTRQSVGQHRMRRAERNSLFQPGRPPTHHQKPQSAALCTRPDPAARAAGLSAALRRRKIYLQSLKHQEFVQAEDCPTSMRVLAMCARLAMYWMSIDC